MFLACLIAGLLHQSVAQTDVGTERVRVLDGSGTTNPQMYFSRIAQTLEDSARVPMKITYRGIGSGAGQSEFVNWQGSFAALNNFGCGDVPLSTAAWTNVTSAAKGNQAVVHIPILIGGVGFFVNLDSFLDARTGPLNLTACTLAKIFTGTIDTWDHADILASNPELKPRISRSNVTAFMKQITVYHRVLGSSSTFAMSNYLKSACPATFTGTPGTTVAWPANKTNFKPADGSGLMSEAVRGTPGAIGYVELGFGLNEGLSEVSLETVDKKGFRNSDTASMIRALGEEGGNPFPADSGADFGTYGTEFINRQNDVAWPMTLVTYLWIRVDQTASGWSGAVLRAFVDYVLSDAGQAILPTYFFEPLPTPIREYARNAAKRITLSPAVTPFTFETFETTQVIAGAAPTVLSGKRQRFLSSKLALLDEISADTLRAIDEQNGQMSVTQTLITNIQRVEKASVGVAAAALFFGLVSFIMSVVALVLIARVNKLSKQMNQYGGQSSMNYAPAPAPMNGYNNPMYHGN